MPITAATQFGYIPVPEEIPPKVVIVAEHVRRKVMNYARSIGGFRGIEFPSLGGACALASSWLFEALNLHGINSSIAWRDLDVYYCHAYNLIDEKFVLDITASQFDLPAINLVPLKDAQISPNKPYKVDRVYSDHRKFIRFIRDRGWDGACVPRPLDASTKEKIRKLPLTFGSGVVKCACEVDCVTTF